MLQEANGSKSENVDKVVQPSKGRSPAEQFQHEVKKCVDKGLERYAADKFKSEKAKLKLRKHLIEKVMEKERGNVKFNRDETPRKIFKLVASYVDKYKDKPQCWE